MPEDSFLKAMEWDNEHPPFRQLDHGHAFQPQDPLMKIVRGKISLSHSTDAAKVTMGDVHH